MNTITTNMWFVLGISSLIVSVKSCETTSHYQRHPGNCNLLIDTCSSYHHFKIHWDANAHLSTGESASSNGWKSQTGSVEHAVQDLFRNLHGCNCETKTTVNPYGCAVQIKICFNFNKAEQDVSNQTPQYEVWATYPGDTTVSGYYCCDYDQSQSIQNAMKKLILQKSCITTKDPTTPPTNAPSTSPTRNPTNAPSTEPTYVPTHIPSNNPTQQPTNDPTAVPTNVPTIVPTSDPTTAPTIAPSNTPTKEPTDDPTTKPTIAPTDDPTIIPTNTPTNNPTKIPTVPPSNVPTNIPTDAPSKSPMNVPTNMPINAPTKIPTKRPTDVPSQTHMIITGDPTAAFASIPSIPPSDGTSNTLAHGYTTAFPTGLEMTSSVVSNILETSQSVPNMAHKSDETGTTGMTHSMTIVVICIGCVLLCSVSYVMFTLWRRKQNGDKQKFNLLMSQEVQITMLCDDDEFRCGFSDI